MNILHDPSQVTNGECDHSLATNFPGEDARIEAGFSLEEAARKLKLSSRYLRHVERRGNASIKLARRLGRLYNCDANLFIFKPEYFTGQKATPTPTPPSAAGADTSTPRAGRRYSPSKIPVLSLVGDSQGGERA